MHSISSTKLLSSFRKVAELIDKGESVIITKSGFPIIEMKPVSTAVYDKFRSERTAKPQGSAIEPVPVKPKLDIREDFVEAYHRLGIEEIGRQWRANEMSDEDFEEFEKIHHRLKER